jgi:Dolichyl-phosphate-mannose-protein mannosyltransferase
VPAVWTANSPGSTGILVSVVASGLILRVASGLLIHPTPVSDMASYDFSARHLLSAHEYLCHEGSYFLRAFRPPGVAFLLAGTMAVVGQQAWAALLLNCILYIGSSFLLWRALQGLPWQASAAAIAMLAIWPSEIAVAGLPQSETPSIFFAASLIYVLVRVESLWTKALLLGILTGLSCLLRNSNLLMIGVWWFVLLQASVPFAKRAGLGLLVVVSAFAPILPWTLRNAHVLGTPVLVATNGGDNFYSANNSLSGGGWEGTSEQETHRYLPDEVAMDKAGFRLADHWIATHPAQFLKLSFEKVRLLLGSDDWGPYWSMERGREYTGPAYRAALIAARLWWLALWSFLLIGFVRQPGLIHDDLTLQAVTAFTFLPSFLFFVFQSQSRYHAFMIPGLLFLGARLNSAALIYAPREGRRNITADCSY